MTLTNNKGIETGKMIYVVSGITNNTNSVTANITSDFIDNNGKSISRAVNNFKCENGVMMMDMKMFMPAAKESTSSVSGDAVYLEYPADMKEGDRLKDGLFNLDVTSSGGLPSTIEISITERIVEGKESVVSAAGRWDCFKISSINTITTKVSGVGLPIKSQVTEWFAPGFGVVKTESKTGKTEITSIK